MTTSLETQFFKWLLKEIKQIGLRSILSFGVMVIGFYLIQRMLGTFSHGVIWIDTEWRSAIAPVAMLVGTTVFGFARHRVNRSASHHKDLRPTAVQVNVSSVEASRSGVDVQSVSITSVATPRERGVSSHWVAVLWAIGLVICVTGYIALYHRYVIPLDENDRETLARNAGVTNIAAEAGSGTSTASTNATEKLGLVMPISISCCGLLSDYIESIRANYPGVSPMEYIMDHDLQRLHDWLARDCYMVVGLAKALLFLCYISIFVCASAATGYAFGPAEVIAELAHR